jgi:hypothetical protein
VPIHYLFMVPPHPFPSFLPPDRSFPSFVALSRCRLAPIVTTFPRVTHVFQVREWIGKQKKVFGVPTQNTDFCPYYKHRQRNPSILQSSVWSGPSYKKIGAFGVVHITVCPYYGRPYYDPRTVFRNSCISRYHCFSRLTLTFLWVDIPRPFRLPVGHLRILTSNTALVLRPLCFAFFP